MPVQGTVESQGNKLGSSRKTNSGNRVITEWSTD